MIFSDFQQVELITALHCKVGRNEITVEDARAVEARIRSEIKTGVLAWQEPAWKRIFTRTTQLAQGHGATTLCRTLDAIHVSIALVCGAERLATLDKRQASLALPAGLEVVHP